MWPYRLANLVSYVLNPFVLPPVFFGVVLAHFDAPRTEIAAAVGLALFFFLVLPLSFVVWMVRRGRTATIEIPERARRTVPYLFGLLCYAAAFGVLLQTGWTAGALLLAVVACHFLNTVLFVLINRRWKISVHTSGLAGFVSMLVFVSHVPWASLAGTSPEALLLHPLPLYGLLGLVPLMVWARVHLGAHTPGQAVAGAAFGLVAPVVELGLVYRLGLLAGL